MIIGHPGTWQQFQFRPDNRGLNVMEMKSKYLHEQYLFEAQMFNLQQQNMFMNGTGGGGPLPSSEPEPTYTYELRLTFNDTLSTVSGVYGFDVTSFEAWNTSNKFSGLEAEAISVDNNTRTIILKSNTDLTQTQIVVSAFAQDAYLIEIEDIHDNYVGSIRATAFFESAVNVVVLNAVNEIQPDRVFKSTTLTRIELNSLTEIGNTGNVSESGDFCRCDLSGANTIQFNSLANIGDYAFELATLAELKGTSFPVLETIGMHGFEDADIQILASNTITSIGERAFYSSKLVEVQLGNNVDFGNESFSELPEFNSLIIPEDCTFGADVFLNISQFDGTATVNVSDEEDPNIIYLEGLGWSINP